MAKQESTENNALKVGELRKLLESVPDDYACVIYGEGQNVTGVEVHHKREFVDFVY